MDTHYADYFCKNRPKFRILYAKIHHLEKKETTASAGAADEYQLCVTRL